MLNIYKIANIVLTIKYKLIYFVFHIIDFIAIQLYDRLIGRRLLGNIM